MCVCARTGLGQATEDSLGYGQVIVGAPAWALLAPRSIECLLCLLSLLTHSLCLSPNRAARIPPRGGDGPSHESEDFPRPLVTLPGRQPQQRPWWTGWFGKAA